MLIKVTADTKEAFGKMFTYRYCSLRFKIFIQPIGPCERDCHLQKGDMIFYDYYLE